MLDDRLGPLQKQMLRVLADVEPAWTLTGGAALAGFHTRHRGTRDLDLFWRGREKLGEVIATVKDKLVEAGLIVDVIQTAPAFVRLRVAGQSEVVILDLVSDPTPAVEPPLRIDWEGVRIQVDGTRELLANKLCTLLSRSELRDLIDVKALLDTGLDLSVGLMDAPKKDLGMSPLVLAWVLRQMPIQTLATAENLTPERVAELERFRDELVNRILALSRPS